MSITGAFKLTTANKWELSLPALLCSTCYLVGVWPKDMVEGERVLAAIDHRMDSTLLSMRLHSAGCICCLGPNSAVHTYLQSSYSKQGPQAWS